MSFSMHNNMQISQKNHSSCCDEHNNSKGCKINDCCIKAWDVIKISLSETNPQIKEPKNIDKTYFNQFLLEQDFFSFENIRKIIPPNQNISKKYTNFYLVWIIKLNI